MSGGRELLDACLQAALAAADPAAAIRRRCRCVGDELLLDGTTSRRFALAGRRVLLAGAGKAAARMALALEEILADHLAAGLVVTKHGHGERLQRTRVLEAGHPVPDQAGEFAARELEHFLSRCRADDLVIFCLSGGASALLPAPRPPLSLADKQAVTRLLLASGTDIAAVNRVRKQLSRLKGGQLARLVAPAETVCLAVSDVVGDDPAVIGSGPFSPDPGSFSDMAAALAAVGLDQHVPGAVHQLLAAGLAGRVRETPKLGDPCFARVTYQLIAENAQALTAAADLAAARGCAVERWPGPLVGEASVAARHLVERARTLRDSGRRCLLLAGGETTVTLGAKPGLGGRNQELALAAALELARDGHGISVLAAGSDGGDGPTDAAGAYADGSTVTRAATLGIDAAAHLRRHDAHPFFRSLNDLLITGPTGTNVMDLTFMYITP